MRLPRPLSGAVEILATPRSVVECYKKMVGLTKT